MTLEKTIDNEIVEIENIENPTIGNENIENSKRQYTKKDKKSN